MNICQDCGTNEFGSQVMWRGMCYLCAACSLALLEKFKERKRQNHELGTLKDYERWENTRNRSVFRISHNDLACVRKPVREAETDR